MGSGWQGLARVGSNPTRLTQHPMIIVEPQTSSACPLGSKLIRPSSNMTSYVIRKNKALPER